MSNLVVGGPVAVNSYDNAIVAALVENRPVMLVHAFNGGFLRPVDLTDSVHDKGVQLSTKLDPVKEAQGHLWYITPAGFFGQRPLYFIESAAGQVTPKTTGAGQADVGRGDDGVPKPHRPGGSARQGR
jgi:hypothetical protein